MSFARRSALLAVLPALAAAQSSPKLDAVCEDVVIFMARGNDAPYHDGRTTPFIDATCAKLAQQGTSCDYIDVQFDVTLGGPYCDQVAEGARNGISEITSFNAKCPNTHIVLNGYSEGAHVAGDILGGPGGCSTVSSGIDNNSAAGKAIAAALLWGDVRHTANQPYNVLDGAGSEKYPRTGNDLALLNRYSSVLRAYCAAGDPVCAGGNVVQNHLNYFELYTDEASSWVVSKINQLKPTSSSAPPSSTPTTMSTSASSLSSQAPSSMPSGSSSSSSAVPTGTGAPGTGASGPGAPGTGAPYPTVSANAHSYSAAPTSAPGSKPSGGAPSGGKPSGGKPSTNKHTGTHPPFPAATPYEGCVVTYEVVTKYV